MIQFTGWEYLLIDAANQFGHDKMLFEERIKWAEDHLHELEALADQAAKKTRPLYLKAVLAIRKALRGEASGHLVGFDGVCSGVQIMSAITGCIEGCKATGLVDTGIRPDAYSLTTQVMNDLLADQGLAVTVSRDDAKQALMTSFYGSRKTPKDIFGEDTPELNAFYLAAHKVAPGAWELLQDLLGSWQPWALEHSWTLPDGYVARVKVMAPKEARIEVDELDHATFTYEFYENEGTKTGLANAANVVHSIDALVLREMHRRCNYNHETDGVGAICVREELERRTLEGCEEDEMDPNSKINYYVGHWARSGFASMVIMPHINATNVRMIPTELLQELAAIIETMNHKPFPIITVHDEFKAHPNYINHMRQHYINILAELADSVIVSDILSQLHGRPGTFTKLSNDLSKHIRNSNYALS